jgi:hypothetical protein
MEVPRPAYGFEFGAPPKDIRSSYDVVVIGLGGTDSDLRNPGGDNIVVFILFILILKYK